MLLLYKVIILTQCCTSCCVCRDLSNNLLDAIPEDIKNMKKLESLYVFFFTRNPAPVSFFFIATDRSRMNLLCRMLGSNPLRNLNNGTIPYSLDTLNCRNCSLQHIPADFAQMKKLTDL